MTIAEIEVFTEPKKTIQAEKKSIHDIGECKKGKIVVLIRGGQSLTGIFKRLDDDETIVLKSLTSKGVTGFNASAFNYYWEEIKD
jgi:hypothetical protein